MTQLAIFGFFGALFLLICLVGNVREAQRANTRARRAKVRSNIDRADWPSW